VRLRAKAKKFIYGSVPVVRGHFRYFGETVYFPLGSHIFERACIEGIYEREITNIVLSLTEPGSTYFDVGANIGLMSVPVLSQKPNVNVVSIEASPSTLPWLAKSHSASPHAMRWTIVGEAVGAYCGEMEFWTGGGATGAFDGARNTGRGGEKRALRLSVRTIDDIWHELGRPAVSVVKMDIEGGERSALQGACNLISRTRPVFIIEWNASNLSAYNIDSNELLKISRDIEYQIFAVPSFVPVGTKPVLKVLMGRTETFLLAPVEIDAGHFHSQPVIPKAFEEPQKNAVSQAL
jgi:FkbM family methyltransferase